MKGRKAIAACGVLALLVGPTAALGGTRAEVPAVIVQAVVPGQIVIAPVATTSAVNNGEGQRKSKRVRKDFNLIGSSLYTFLLLGSSTGTLDIGNGSSTNKGDKVNKSRGAN